MVFQPSSTNNNAQTQNPIAPKGVQAETPVVHQFQQQQAQMPVIEQSPVEEEPPQQLSGGTSNDEIQELLVAILEELCNLKQAMYSGEPVENQQDVVDMPNRDFPEGAGGQSKEETPSQMRREDRPSIDFAHCF